MIVPLLANQVWSLMRRTSLGRGMCVKMVADRHDLPSWLVERECVKMMVPTKYGLRDRDLVSIPGA